MPATYRYPLQTLQDLRGAALPALRIALADAERRILDNEHDMASYRHSIRDAEEALRVGMANGVLPVDQHRVARLYLDHLQRMLAQLAMDAIALQSDKEECMAALGQARSALRMLELHHARLAAEHAINEARCQQRELDDSWLGRVARRGGAQ